MTKAKDPVPQENRTGVIYKISCDCGEHYIGETKRTLDTRVKEHLTACKYVRFKRSAVAEHAWQDGHRIDWEGVKMLDVASNYEERLVKEAVYIHLSTPGVRMNRDKGKEISRVWHGPLKKLSHQDSHPCRRRTSAMQTTSTSTASAPPTEVS